MERKVTRKAFTALGLICFLSFMIPAKAFCWNQATHAYIADQLGARVGHENLSEMWGSVAPDFFNYIFDPSVCPGWVSDQTHGMYAETFLKVWNAARSEKEFALAYGFLSHNEPWGADHVAHESSLTLDSNEGYIITKAKLLLETPVGPATPHPTFGELFAGSFGMGPDEALLIAHAISEYAVDIRLGNEADPLLGRKLATAARGETKRFTDLLVKAYAADYATSCFAGDKASAVSVLTAAEKKHRDDMIYLGRAISRPKQVAVQLLAEQLAAILPDFLGRTLPADALEILKTGITTSMTLCDDYVAEIEATIKFVDQSLKGHGIVYTKQGNPKRRQ
jgi:hypothetical protein